MEGEGKWITYEKIALLSGLWGGLYLRFASGIQISNWRRLSIPIGLTLDRQLMRKYTYRKIRFSTSVD